MIAKFEFELFKGFLPGAKIVSFNVDTEKGHITCEVEAERDLTLRANGCKGTCCA